MRSKRRKSETTSDGESDENGVARTATADGNGEVSVKKKNNEPESPSTDVAQTPRKTPAKKRTSRGRHSRKSTSEEPVEETHDDQEEIQDASTEEKENGNVIKGGGAGVGNKRRKKEDLKASTSTQEKAAAGGEEEEYEVEKIVGHRTIKGRHQFLVRWKGYGEDSDTWEQEKDLNCRKLIEEFLDEDENTEEDAEKHIKQTSKSLKTPKAERKPKKPRSSFKKEEENDEDLFKEEIKDEKDNQKEFEVEKILEVHFKKNKTREFLIRWKGFTSADDTWEPEENLNCPELISKFMQKVEKAKTADMRELRTNRPHTKRYTLTTHESGRRLSRRNMDKQRATYHECDE